MEEQNEAEELKGVEEAEGAEKRMEEQVTKVETAGQTIAPQDSSKWSKTEIRYQADKARDEEARFAQEKAKLYRWSKTEIRYQADKAGDEEARLAQEKAQAEEGTNVAQMIGREAGDAENIAQMIGREHLGFLEEHATAEQALKNANRESAFDAVNNATIENKAAQKFQKGTRSSTTKSTLASSGSPKSASALKSSLKVTKTKSHERLQARLAACDEQVYGASIGEADRNLKARVRVNILAMLEGCSDAEEQKDRLLAGLQSGAGLEQMVMRDGWEKVLEAEQSRLTSFGVVAAIILNTVFGMVGVELVPNADDDLWSDQRDTLQSVHSVASFISASSSVGCVILSVVWLGHSKMFLRNADDFIWYKKTVPPTAIEATLILSVFSLIVTMCSQVVVLGSDPSTSICFLAGLVFFACFFLPYHARSLGLSQARLKASLQKTAPFYIDVLEEVCPTVTVKEPETSSQRLSLIEDTE